jgi:hypothetical protein
MDGGRAESTVPSTPNIERYCLGKRPRSSVSSFGPALGASRVRITEILRYE